MKRLGVVSVTYNSSGDLPEFFKCLDRVRDDCTGGGIDLRAVIVDNNSTDSTVALSREASERSDGWLHLVANDSNRGVAAGNNQGILLFRGAVDYILLLNVDTTFSADLARRLVRGAEMYPGAVLTPQIRSAYDPELLWYDGGHVERRRAFRARHVRLWEQAGKVDTKKQETVGYASTCALLVPWAALVQVGLMDEDFFVYCDDVDFSLRLTDAGWATVLDRDTVMFHKVGGSTGGTRSKFGARWETYGMVLLARKHSASAAGVAASLAYVVGWCLWQTARRREPARFMVIRLAACWSGLRRRISRPIVLPEADTREKAGES